MNTISYLTQPAVHMPMQQPPYFATPPGFIATGAAYAGAVGIQVLYFYFIYICCFDLAIINIV